MLCASLCTVTWRHLKLSTILPPPCQPLHSLHSEDPGLLSFPCTFPAPSTTGPLHVLCPYLSIFFPLLVKAKPPYFSGLKSEMQSMFSLSFGSTENHPWVAHTKFYLPLVWVIILQCSVCLFPHAPQLSANPRRTGRFALHRPQGLS